MDSSANSIWHSPRGSASRWPAVVRNRPFRVTGRRPYSSVVAEMHDATEEYLETILEIEEEGIPPIRARLVERLGISAPAVSETVNRLVEQGYAQLLDDRSLRFTAKGRTLAEPGRSRDRERVPHQREDRARRRRVGVARGRATDPGLRSGRRGAGARRRRREDGGRRADDPDPARRADVRHAHGLTQLPDASVNRSGRPGSGADGRRSPPPPGAPSPPSPARARRPYAAPARPCR